ncbi:MAG: DnaJ domain-containing protein [Candidatus Moeniiplasma glomeromycotorum]|nr:DnaJ domain-containing protein [Candidatus Moeniiplasma glomeromycotorum]
MVKELKEYYKILKIDNEKASKSEIRAAYIKLAKETHPDKVGNESKIEEFKKINKAYEVLIDENKRREYDGGNDVSIVEYGYDYGEKIPDGELAVKKYTNHISELEKAWQQLHFFYADTDGFRTREGNIVSDYHLKRAQDLIKLLDKYYKPKYLAGKVNLRNEFNFWVYETWDAGFNKIKTMLNYARKKLELPALTDNDLKFKPIEGKKPNESPEIPDGKEPAPIKDGVIDVEKYNKSFDESNNETVRKFWELRGKIYNEEEDYKKFKKVNPSLFGQMDNQANEAEKGNFRTIWDTDEATKISEIKTFNNGKLSKMSEAIKLMEKLIAESSKDQNNSVSEPKGKKREFESEARQDREKKSKTTASELKRLISEAEGKNDYGELEAKIKEIDKYQGEEEYVSHQEKIDQLKVRLGNLDKDKFRQLTIKKIEGLMKDNQLKESELDQKDKQELESLKNESDISKINELENKIGEKIGKKGALNSLSKLLEEAKNLVKSTAKTATEEILKQADKIKKDLYAFRFSTNNWKTNAYQDKENEVKSMLNQLESFSTQTAQKPKSVFSRPEIMFPAALVVVLGIVGVSVAIAKKRKKAKVE